MHDVMRFVVAAGYTAVIALAAFYVPWEQVPHESLLIVTTACFVVYGSVIYAWIWWMDSGDPRI